MLFAERPQLRDARLFPLTHDHGALLATGTVGERQIVGGREHPLIALVQQEGEILGVVVAVIREHVKAGQRIDLFDLDDIPRQQKRNTQDSVVIETGMAVIGVNEPGQTMHMDAGVASAVETSGTEIPLPFLRKE